MLSSRETVPVSVVIPCFRCCGTIRRALESVLGQTVKPAEVLLIDDCSGDETAVELEGLRQQLGSDWIKIISLRRNEGAAGARNVGWEAATQRYIAFLDADDAWMPSKVELQFSFMESTPSAGISAHVRRSRHGAHSLTTPVGDPNWRRIRPSQFVWRNLIATSSVMLLRDLPLRFDPRRRYSEDYLLWLQAAFGGWEVFRSELPLAVSYKADYGAGGLSGRLWMMEQGELRNLRWLRSNGHIGTLQYVAAVSWSLARFARRVVVSSSLGRRSDAAVRHSASG